MHKSEIIYKGVWLDKLPSTTKWWKMTNQLCIFRMQAVVDAQLEIHERRSDNVLIKNIHGDMVCNEDDNGVCRISNKDHY